MIVATDRMQIDPGSPPISTQWLAMSLTPGPHRGDLRQRKLAVDDLARIN